MLLTPPRIIHQRAASILWTWKTLLCSLIFISATTANYADKAVIEVNMRISLEGQRTGAALVQVFSNGEEQEHFDATIKDENFFYLALGDTYMVVVSSPGFASKSLLFDTTHPKAREGKFPCDIDLFESEESNLTNPPVVGIISWNNFRKSWIHKVAD